MIRALIDANILISFLLTPSSKSPAIAIITAAIGGRFRMLIASETIVEVRDKVVNKAYLSERISSREVEALIVALRGVAEILPELTGTVPIASRDRNDDYLLAQALKSGAEFLITGDRDLLSLRVYRGVEILSPHAFAERLSPEDSGAQG